MSAAVHIKAVEVKRCWLVAEIIDGIDNDLVANICFDDWERPLSIDTNGWPVEHAIGVCCHPRYIEIIGDGGSCGQGCY